MHPLLTEIKSTCVRKSDLLQLLLNDVNPQKTNSQIPQNKDLIEIDDVFCHFCKSKNLSPEELLIDFTDDRRSFNRSSFAF